MAPSGSWLGILKAEAFASQEPLDADLEGAGEDPGALQAQRLAAGLIGANGLPADAGAPLERLLAQPEGFPAGFEARLVRVPMGGFAREEARMEQCQRLRVLSFFLCLKNP